MGVYRTGITLVHAGTDPDSPKEQSKLDRGIVEILNAALGRTGVVSGCAVSAQGTPDGTVAVAAGTIESAGVQATVSSGNLNVLSGGGSTAADATLGRFDLVVASNAGAKSIVFGTPAAAPEWPMASVTSTSVVLAAIYVPPTVTTVPSNHIHDLRALLANRAKTVWLPIDLRSPLTNVAYADLALTAWTRGAYVFTKDVDGKLHGVVTVPPNLAPTPNASIKLVTGYNATSGVSRWIVSSKRFADGVTYDPSSLTAETGQDITVPATARLRKDVNFALTNLGAPVAGEELIVEIFHNGLSGSGSGANDTVAVDSELLDAFLVCDVV